MTAYPITDVPCAPWATSEEAAVSGPCKGAPGGDLDDALAAASAWLWRITGKVYGICPVTVLPLGHATCYPACSGYETWGGTWYFDRTGNCWFGGTGRVARGEGVPEVRLGFANVQTVTQVVVAGTILDPGAYRVDDGRWLVRLDGGLWPLDNDPRLSPPAFQVTLTHGLPIPPDGGRAAAVLACEILLAATNDSACRLPKRVSSITRQGVSMVVLDPLTLLDDGKFGIPEVDYFVQSVNPHGLRQRAKVLSPDVPRSVRIPTSPRLGPL